MKTTTTEQTRQTEQTATNRKAKNAEKKQKAKAPSTTPTAENAPEQAKSRFETTMFLAWKKLETLVGRGAVKLFVAEPALTRQPTGIVELDGILDGGLPKGRLVEIFGPPGSGKTTLSLRICSAVHRAGGVAAFVDVDNGIDRSTLARAGVDGERLVLARPEGGEAALHVVDELLSSHAADVIIVDSVAALVPKAELLGVTGGAPAGHHARLMSQALRRLTLQAARSGAVVVFVNQLRRNWGDDGKGVDVTTGGNALPYAAATRIALQRSGTATRMTLVKARFGMQGNSTVVDDDNVALQLKLVA